MAVSWWNTWYEQATQAVGASMEAAQRVVAPLFKEPVTGSSAYTPDDPPLSDRLRDRQSGTPLDLYSVEPGPWAIQTDLQQRILERPKTWDEMSWWDKFKVYTGQVIPDAAFETMGVTMEQRHRAEEPGTYTGGSDRLRSGAEVAGQPLEQAARSAFQSGGTAVKGFWQKVSEFLGGFGGFLQGTLTRVIVIIALLLIGIFMLNRFLAKRGI